MASIKPIKSIVSDLRMRLPATSTLLLGFSLMACDPLTKAPDPEANPLSGNQITVNPGATCALTDFNLTKIGGSAIGDDLIDGQCEQPWTSLSYQERNPNPGNAQCKINYQTGVSYHYSYQQPQTDVTYYTSSQSYDIPQTTINYYTATQSYDIPRTDISYYTSSQSYDVPQTKISYYTSRQEYDAPMTHVVYYTQQGSYSLDLVGGFSAVGCANFVAGKLPSGYLTDADHLPVCSVGTAQHKVGACSASDTSIQNCTTVYALASTGNLTGDYTTQGCATFASGKLPASAILGDATHPITCSAQTASHQTGACSVSDTSISNCTTSYTQATLTKQRGDYTSVGCATFANGKLPASAILGDAAHPISCAAAAAGNQHVTGSCSLTDSSILNCTTTFAAKSATVDGVAGADCTAFANGKISGYSLDAAHLPACVAAANPRHVNGSCSASDSSILNCTTAYSTQTLRNIAGDFTSQGCATFANGKLPAAAIFGDAAHPLSCALGTPANKTSDGTETFGNLPASLAGFLPTANSACGADFSAYLASSKGLPSASACTITALQNGNFTFDNMSCSAAAPTAYCSGSGGLRKNCAMTDIPAGTPYATAFTTLKQKGTFTCNTLCSDTNFCTSLTGTVGDNYHNCSATPDTSTVGYTFTGAKASNDNICTAGLTKVVKNGPYHLQQAPGLQARLPDNSCIKTKVCLQDSAWKKLNPTRTIPSIDLVILFDETSSMTPYIQAMTLNLQNLIRNLNGLTPNLRLGLAGYRDFADAGGQDGDLPYMLHTPLTSDTQQVINALGTLRASGGGDLPESLSTAIRAAVNGQAMAGYFGASDMGWQDDSSRVKIILGISDAADKKTGLPPGAATLDDTVNLLKTKGILFLGIGYKDQVEAHPGDNALKSYSDLAYLAQNTGGVVNSTGLDLDGDGQTTTYGELAPGAPAVLLMTPTGQLQGAPNNADPTRVLADAISKMVETTRPFQFSLTVNGDGRTYTPAQNSLSLPPETVGQQCFTQVSFAPKNMNAACGVSSPIAFSVSEASTSSDVDNSDYLASVSVDESCAALSTPPTDTSTPTDWVVQGFDGTTTSNSATLIWQTPKVNTTATVHVGIRADQLTLQTLQVTTAQPTQIVTITGLDPDTTYFFQVDTRDAQNHVVTSTVLSKKTKP